MSDNEKSELSSIIKRILKDRKYQKYQNLNEESLYCIKERLNRSEAVAHLKSILGRSKSQEYVDILYDKTSDIRYKSQSKNITKTNRNKHEQPLNVPLSEDVSKIENSKIDYNVRDIENNNSTSDHVSINSKNMKLSLESNINIPIPNKYITGASEKVQQINILASKIHERLERAGLANDLKPELKTDDIRGVTNQKIVLNETGQVIDAITGLPVSVIQPVPTAKVNVRAKRKQLARAAAEEFRRTLAKEVELKEESRKIANDMLPVSSLRTKKSLIFNDPGKYTSMAKNLRNKVLMQELEDRISLTAKATGIASATKSAMVTIIHESEGSSKIPDIEWWDLAILPSISYISFNNFATSCTITDVETTKLNELLDNLAGISNLIEHPVLRQPPGEARDSLFLPVFLTKQEQKRIRVQKRKLHEKEKQENIILGLIPPPAPKGTEAVQDPTKVENYVRGQIEARVKAHEAANAARKLTPSQKKAKLLKKYKDDTSVVVYSTVYRVWDLSDRSKSFKVDTNAQQNHMTGCIILHKDMNLVIVEGGPKAQKRFRRLMLNRIKWSHNDTKISEDQVSERTFNPLQNKCVVIWEGTNGYHNFKEWTVKQVNSEASAKEFLRKFKSDHFWDIAETFSS